MSTENDSDVRLTNPSSPRRFDDRGRPTGELMPHPDTERPIDVPLFASEHVVALTPAGPWHHTPTGMLYAAATNPGDHPVAEVVVDGRLRRLKLPGLHQPKTIDEWNHRQETARLSVAVANEHRQRKLQANRRPVTLAFVEGVELPTIKAAHDYLVEHEALTEVVDGRLRIEVDPDAGDIPGFSSSYGARQLRNALKVLFAAEALVVDCLANELDLPDAHIDPNGRIIP